MIAEFKAFFELFQHGKELKNSAKWKNKQAIANDLLATLSAAALIAHGFGYQIDIDRETMTQAALGIAAIYGVINKTLTVITSARIGSKLK